MRRIDFIRRNNLYFSIIENDCGDSSDEQNCQGDYDFK
jgi:hypothetical protein